MTATPILALLVLMALGWQGLKQLNGLMNRLVEDEFAVLIDQEITPLIAEDMLPVINEDVPYAQALTRSIQLMLEADRDAHQAVIAEKMALVSSGEEFEAADATNLENVQQIEQRMAQAAERFDQEDVKQLYADFQKAFAEWKGRTRNVITLAGTSGKLQFARKASDGGSAQTTFDAMRGLIDQLQQCQEAHVQTVLAKLTEKRDKINGKQETVAARRANVDQTAQSASRRAATLVALFLAIGAVAATAAVVISVLFTRSIVGPLKEIIAGLTEGADQVSSASSQVSGASQSLAEGATEQAAGLQETSSSLEEMSSMTRQNADNAQQANALAAEAQKAAGTGAESMGRMNAAIQEIQKSSDETAKIIKVIDEIAFQTNLLALNAAVEAARAGEAGKGFAVVAEEVRNLAMRSAEAAKNTAGMIEESVKNSKNGVDIAGEVSKVLDEIVQSVSKTTDLVSEIAAASQEQAQGIDQVNTAMSQMDKVTQQNAANAEESASASEELSAQAESLADIVERLVLLVDGGAARKGRVQEAEISRRNEVANSEHKFHATGQARSASRGFGPSDEVLHQIARRPKESRRVVSQSAGKMIPLDDGADDLREFNG